MATAAARWREALAEWAIPQEILDRAPVSPWHFPVSLFASRADQAGSAEPTSSNRRALEALPPGGSVLDVGCGAGAASLPLASRGSHLIGVDPSAEMLHEFADRAGRAGVEATAIEGSWPEVAGQTPVADVVVCHHVVYNAANLASFARELTGHARGRVVLEMTLEHPLSNLNPLWMRFHGVVRPTRPTADDAVDVLSEAGLDVAREDWNAPRTGGFETREDLVAWVRRLLRLPAERDAEIAEEIGGRVVERSGRWELPDRPVATIWWAGSGR